MTRLAKLTDLFQEGAVCPVTTATGTVMPIWLNKLSPFEMEQANHEGRIARARVMLAIREVGTPEYDLFAGSAGNSKPDSIIHGLLAQKANEHLVKAMRDLHSDKDWTERLEVLDWSGEQLDGKADDDPEVQLVSKVLTEYQEELDTRTKYLQDELRAELEALPPDALREQFLEAYVEEQGLRAFTREQQKTQLFYSLRQCEGTDHGEGAWTHENCDHSRRWLERRDEVDQLPGLLVEQVAKAYEAMTMPPDVARFSAGPASSSESHGPSSKQEESTPSTPEETSAEPAGTSS